jgi:hypothetical protein
MVDGVGCPVRGSIAASACPREDAKGVLSEEMS